MIEALTGGDFAERIPSRWLVTPEDGVSLDETSSQLAQDIKRYEAMLKVGRPILVGHNQFYDLCFIYRAFIGPLPSTSGAFSREIHRLFPRIVDTKHLASRGDHSMVADDSLAELFASVRNEEYPQLTQDPGFQYGYGRAAAHQAGFDSKSRLIYILGFTSAICFILMHIPATYRIAMAYPTRPYEK